MLREKIQFNNIVNQDLNDEDYLRKVFESGTDEELKKITDYHNLSPEQTKIFSHFAKLRKGIILEMQATQKERAKNNPIATDVELNMGAYQENIEPQVREVVSRLRKKGYATYESGFGGFDSQVISFENNCLENFQMPDQVIDKFKDQGVVIEIKPNSIKLIFKNEFDQSEIYNFWQELENYLPDLGEPAQPCQLRQAVLFREKQKSFE